MIAIKTKHFNTYIVKLYVIDKMRQYYSFYLSITSVFTAKGKTGQNPVTYKMNRTTRAGVHSQRKATGPQLPKPGEKAKLEGSRSV